MGSASLALLDSSGFPLVTRKRKILDFLFWGL